MIKEDFLVRTVTLKSNDSNISVSRTRTSAGFASITIEVRVQSALITDAESRKITLTNEGGNEYEQQVSALAELLQKIMNEPCLLDERRD